MRVKRDNRCPDCKQVPKHDAGGRLSCACPDKSWNVVLGVEGNEQERALLASKGFAQAKDVRGDVYYLGPYSRIVWLFADGTWSGDKAADDESLEAYLNAIPEDETLM